MKKLLLIKNSFNKTNFKPHIHENFSIGIITGGKCKLNINKDKKLINTGEIRIINPFETHYVENNIKWSYINFFVEKEYIKTIFSSVLQKNNKYEIKFQNHISNPEAVNLLKKIVTNSDKGLNSLEKEENIIEFFALLIKKHSSIRLNEKNKNYNLKLVLDYIHTHFLENITLQDLENITVISKYHIIRMFKKEFFLTPYQFIIKLRIEYALKLINKGYPLSLVAVEAGFFDQSHFIKEFKKIYGISPLKFIKNIS